MRPAVALSGTLDGLMGFVAIVFGLGLTVAMARQVAGSPGTGVPDALRFVRFRLGRLVRLGCGCGAVVLPILWFVGYLVFGRQGMRVGGAPGTSPEPGQSGYFYLGLLVVSALIMVRLGFAFNAALFLDQDVRGSVRHAWTLTKGRWAWVLGYLLIANLPSMIAIPLAFRTGQPPYATNVLAWQLAVGLLAALWSIFGTALWLLVWYRLRDEQERLGLPDVAAELAADRRG
jgi:hypothetical protein